jgi:hypothetical protein
VTLLWAGWSRVRILVGVRDFSLLQNLQIGSGAQPDSCSLGTGVLSQDVKRLWHEVNHSPPSSAEVKNEWSYTSAYTRCLPGVERENITFVCKVIVILHDNFRILCECQTTHSCLIGD